MHCSSNLEAVNLAPGATTMLLTVNMDVLEQKPPILISAYKYGQKQENKNS
jgi:hypothetical protein